MCEVSITHIVSNGQVWFFFFFNVSRKIPPKVPTFRGFIGNDDVLL